MGDKEALLRAIWERPEDDAVRLVYADWLEEHGDKDDLARAEFIRVQVRLAGDSADTHRAALLKREQQLLRGRRAKWEAGRPAWAAKGEWRRGFYVPRLRESLGRFLKRRPEELRGFPLWSFTLTGAENRGAKLAGCKLLTRAVELNLTSNALGAEGIRQFASCPYLGNVEVLGLRRNWMRDEGLNELVKNASLPRLRELGLGGNWLGDKGMATLADAPFLSNLTSLGLGFNHVLDEGGVALVRSGRLGRLEVLHLGENNLGDGAARAFAATDCLPRLRSLKLARQITDEGAAAVAGSAWLRQLQQLVLLGNWRLTSAGKAALRQAFGQRVEV